MSSIRIRLQDEWLPFGMLTVGVLIFVLVFLIALTGLG
jgi:hypothetical protein